VDWNIEMKINELLAYDKAGEQGLGVFAMRYIKKGTPLLIDIVRTISKGEKFNLRSSDIYHHFFVDRSQYDVNPQSCDLHIAFGPISMVNHSDSPNCDLKWSLRGIFSNVELLALADIFPGEEITIQYKNIVEYDFFNKNKTIHQ